MSFSLKPDYEVSKKRYDAFWEQAVIDRPPISVVLDKKGALAFPKRDYPSHEARWLDVEYRAERMAHELASKEYPLDGLPIAWPNLGPEVFSAWCGCPYIFGEGTTWSEPCITDWEMDVDATRLNMDHPLFKALITFTERLLELGKGRFIVGLTDFHPGGDHLAALRDPQALAMDLLDHPDEVKRVLGRSAPEFFAAYGVFYNMVHSAGMPTTSWTPLIADNTFYIPSNDFSCMISPAMFEEFFLEGIRQECAFYERSIYHLDGPGALKHLNALLEIRELDAVQWVCGAGNEGFARWAHVYKRIQDAGKSLQLDITLSELPMVFEVLRPEGVWFNHIGGVYDRDTASAVEARISKWG